MRATLQIRVIRYNRACNRYAFLLSSRPLDLWLLCRRGKPLLEPVEDQVESEQATFADEPAETPHEYRTGFDSSCGVHTAQTVFGLTKPMEAAGIEPAYHSERSNTFAFRPIIVPARSTWPT